MSRNLSIWIIIIICIGSGRILPAQDLTNPQRRHINLQVYSLLEKYSRYGKLSSNYNSIDESYLFEFASLFDSSAKIFNDILPYNRMDNKISVQEYLRLSANYYSSGIGFRLHNKQIEIPIRYAADTYQVNVHVLKEIYGTTVQNANYKDTLSLTFNIGFRMQGSNPVDFKIRGISGQSVGRTLRLFIVDNKTSAPLNNIRVKFNDRTYYTNNSGRLELKDLDPHSEYSYSITAKKYRTIKQPGFYVDNILNSKVQVNPQADYFDPNEIIERLKPSSRFYISMHFAPAVTQNSIHLDIPQNGDTATYSRTFDYHFGIKTGYAIYTSGKLAVALLTGLEYSKFSTNVSFEKYQGVYSGTDLEGYPLVIPIEITGNQLIKSSGFTLPIHFLIKYNLFDKISLDVESGINFNFLSNRTYENLDVTYNYDITNDSIPGNGEHISLADTSRKWTGNNIASFYISPQLSWDISPSVEIYGGPSLIIGLGNLSNSTEQDPLTIEDGALSSLTDFAEKTTLRAWFIEIGLRYRFNGLKGSSKN